MLLVAASFCCGLAVNLHMFGPLFSRRGEAPCVQATAIAIREDVLTASKRKQAEEEQDAQLCKK